MTNKIIEAAREAGFVVQRDEWVLQTMLRTFYAIAYKQGLEDAAKLLETKKEWRGGKWISTLSPETASAIANAIRALKEQQHG